MFGKEFLRLLKSETTTNENDYYLYQKIKSVAWLNTKNGSFALDNIWVVPFNFYLLRKYNCHMNIEVCKIINAVKYFSQYVYKGNNYVIVAFKDCNNKVRAYLLG